MSLEKSLHKLRLSSDSSDSSDTSEDNDSYYCGLWGLDKLYRVCRDDEAIKKGIQCRARGSSRSVEDHINSGSKYFSRYISTTTSRDVALKWAYYTMENKYIQEREKPQKIIEIYIFRIPPDTAKKMINLTVEEVRNHFLGGATQICRAKASQEVIFQKFIPKTNQCGETVYRLWKNPPKPPTPKSKKRPKKKY